jgi:hypothetical protein
MSITKCAWILLAAGLMVVLWAGHVTAVNAPVKSKPGAVTNTNEMLDYQKGGAKRTAREQPSDAGSTKLANDLVEILSKTFTPPGKLTFQPFGGEAGPWVDFEVDPTSIQASEEGKSHKTAIRVKAVHVPLTAGMFPLQCEGNLTGTGTGNNASHWSAKVAKFKLIILFQTVKMQAAGIAPKPIPEGDSVSFSAKTEPDLNLPSDSYVWSGTQPATGKEVSVSFGWRGASLETITVQGVSETAYIIVINVPPPNQYDWSKDPSHWVSAVVARWLAREAAQWVDANLQALGGGRHNGKADAALHAYWNAIMTLDPSVGPLAAEAATAHERTNIETGDPHNESVMDEMNNAEGRRIGGGLPADATRAQVQGAVIGALNAGKLRYLDDLGNAQERGSIQPSNK